MSIQLTKPHGNLKLNDSMITALSEAIAKGNYLVTACNLVGIEEDTFRRWLDNANEDYQKGLTEEESLFIRFHRAIKKAEAEAEAKLVEVVRSSAEVDRNWVAGMTFLERRHPDRWGRRDRVAGGNTFNLTYIEKQENKSLIDAGEKLRGLLKVGSELETPENQSEGERKLLQEGNDVIE